MGYKREASARRRMKMKFAASLMVDDGVGPLRKRANQNTIVVYQNTLDCFCELLFDSIADRIALSSTRLTRER